MDNFKEASRIGLRIETSKGLLSTEQLWTLEIEELDKLAVKLHSEYESSNTKSFIIKKTQKDKIAKLKFDITLEIMNTKIEEAETLREAKKIKDHNEKILTLIGEKKDEELKGKSISELKEMLK